MLRICVCAPDAMDEDHVFTKRFIECVKKTEEERNEQVSSLPHSTSVMCVSVCLCTLYQIKTEYVYDIP